MVWFETSHITKLRCLLAAGGPQHLDEAESLIAVCMAHVERTHNQLVWVQLTALHSLLLDRRGERKAASDLLAKALAAAEPEGFVRSFVDLGAPLADLLGAIKKPALAGYVNMLLAAIPHNAPIQHKTIIFSDYPAATLTERETEVLALLASPLSLQEIGDKLFISYSTVRQHTGHIYEKLGVNKRRHAVLAANKLGLL